MAIKRRHRWTANERTLDQRAETLRRRARRQARRGNCRKAALALREVAGLTGEARAWVALGDMLRRAGRTGEAVSALREGLWQHRRAGRVARARVVARLILSVDPSDVTAARLVGLGARAA